MEQTANFYDTSEYLCGICPNRFSRSTLIRHITEHIRLHGQKHAHALWCQLCSPLLRRSDVHVDDQHSDLNQDDDPRYVDSDHRNFVDGDYYLVPDGHYFSSRMNGVYDDSTFLRNGEFYYFSDNSLNASDTRIQDEFYDGTDISPNFNNNGFNEHVMSSFNTVTAPPDSRDLTNNSCPSLSMNVGSLSDSSSRISRVDDVDPLQATPNAVMNSSGCASHVGPRTEATNAEILRVEDITYVKPNHTEDAFDEESHLSDFQSTKFQADASNSNNRRIRPNTRARTDTMNFNSSQGGERGNGRESASSVNCLQTVANVNGNTSSVSSEDTKENLTYSAVVKRGLSTLR